MESLLESKHTDLLSLEEPREFLALPLCTVDVPGGKDTLLTSKCLGGPPPGTSSKRDMLTDVPPRQVFLAPQAVQYPRHSFRLDKKVVPEAMALPAATQFLDYGRTPDPQRSHYPIPHSVRGQVSHLPDADPPHRVSGSAVAGACLCILWCFQVLQSALGHTTKLQNTRSYTRASADPGN